MITELHIQYTKKGFEKIPTLQEHRAACTAQLAAIVAAQRANAAKMLAEDDESAVETTDGKAAMLSKSGVIHPLPSEKSASSRHTLLRLCNQDDTMGDEDTMNNIGCWECGPDPREVLFPTTRNNHYIRITMSC